MREETVERKTDPAKEQAMQLIRIIKTSDESSANDATVNPWSFQLRKTSSVYW